MKTLKQFLTEADSTRLWQFNQRTGLWDYVRTCDGTGDQWLAKFQADEPNEVFKLSKNKPSKAPVIKESDDDDITLTIGWEPVPVRPWVVRVTGSKKLVKRFDTSEQADAFTKDHKKVKAALKAIGILIESKNITPSEPTQAQRNHVGGLAARKELILRQQAAKSLTGPRKAENDKAIADLKRKLGIA